jgi:hypothetical protein
MVQRILHSRTHKRKNPLSGYAYGGGFIARPFHAAATGINQQITHCRHSFNQHAHCRHGFTAEQPNPFEQANPQADPQADPQAVAAKRLEQTPAEICAGGDVFSLGVAPTDSSEKEAIQDVVTSHRSGAHQEFKMEPMPLSDDDLVLLTKFQELHVSKTGGARKYFLVQVMYEISQRYWTLGEFKASYKAFGAKNFLAETRKVVRPLRQSKDTSVEDLEVMRDIGILARRMDDYANKMLNNEQIIFCENSRQ